MKRWGAFGDIVQFKDNRFGICDHWREQVGADRTIDHYRYLNKRPFHSPESPDFFITENFVGEWGKFTTLDEALDLQNQHYEWLIDIGQRVRIPETNEA